MTKDELNSVGIYADTATFIHGHAYNILHDGDRASLYGMSNGGNDAGLAARYAEHQRLKASP